MKNKKLYGLIVVLAVIALAGMLVGELTQFYSYKYSIRYDEYQLNFEFPHTWWQTITIILELVPCVLLLLYITVFHRKNQASAVFPIVCALPAVTEIMNYISTVEMYNENYYARQVPPSYAIVMIANIIILALLTWQALKGMQNKTYLAIACAFRIIWPLQYILSYIDNTNYYEKTPLVMLSGIGGAIGSTVFYLAILLFAFNFKIPSIQNKKEYTYLKPEKELEVLKNRLDSGDITEEEYKGKRAEIISKL